MKISTKEYTEYKVGDLLVYKEGQGYSDIGYIEKISVKNKAQIFHVYWFKDQASQTSDETIQTLMEYTDTFVFPVSKE